MDDVLSMGATYGHDVMEVALNVVARSGQREATALQRIVAVLGVLHVEGNEGPTFASDLFIRGDASGTMGAKWDEFEEFLRSHRVVRWDDELSALLDAGAVTMASVKNSDPRNRYLGEFFVRHKARKRAP